MLAATAFLSTSVRLTPSSHGMGSSERALILKWSTHWSLDQDRNDLRLDTKHLVNWRRFQSSRKSPQDANHGSSRSSSAADGTMTAAEMVAIHSQSSGDSGEIPWYSSV